MGPGLLENLTAGKALFYRKPYYHQFDPANPPAFEKEAAMSKGTAMKKETKKPKKKR
jgi:hypothetical protein